MIKITIAGIVAVLLIAILFFVLSFEGPVAAIVIKKVSGEPAGYFDLTENDLNKYPVLRELLDEMNEQNKNEIIREVNWKLGGEISEYMLARYREESSEGGEGIHFKYLGEFYSFGLIV